ncbi:MAG: BA14K family protein [Alphaproteobacteria bacterium]|nr:MAG: BA14K family protein [Alphaproteobacteria bacterium]
MFKRPLVKPLLGAAALIALTAVFSSSAANAGPASCSAYARDVAASEAPRRGLIDGVLIGTLDAVFTGGAGADERYRDAYDDAYTRCMNSERVAYVVPRRAHVVVGVHPAVGTEEWVAYCSGRYRTFDPDTGMYVTYTGESVPCR